MKTCKIKMIWDEDIWIAESDDELVNSHGNLRAWL